MLIPPAEWKNIFPSSALHRINNVLSKERVILLPEVSNVYKPFELVAPKNVKVIWVNDFPHPYKSVCDGFGFSCSALPRPTMELQRVHDSLLNDVGVDLYGATNLTSWASSGVLLMNRTFTCRLNYRNAHRLIGWDEVLLSLIRYFGSVSQNIFWVFSDEEYGERPLREIKTVKSFDGIGIGSLWKMNHRSIRSIENSKVFSKIDSFLQSKGNFPIDWGSPLFVK